MKSLYFKELLRNRVSFSVYCVLIIFFIWTYVALFPTIQEQSESFDDVLQTMPEAVRKAFGITDLGFETIEQFMSIELMSLIWPLLAVLLAASRAGTSVAGEIENRTIGLTLSLPFNRVQIMITKIFASVTALFTFTFITMFSVFILATLYSIEIRFENVLTMFFLSLLFIFSLYSISLMVSSFVSEKGKVWFSVGAFALVSYVANLVASLNSNIDFLKYFSIFYYFDYDAAFTRSSISGLSIAVFSSIIVICLSIAIAAFRKRDISI